jgi:hypothetical protein
MLSTEIQPYFTTDEINELSVQTGFVQRCSGKLDGATFLDLIVFHKDELKSQSLNNLCFTALKEYGIEIKKQSLHERFNKNAVFFLAAVLEKLLQKNLQKERFFEKIQGFDRILIKDSTCFQVSDNAKKDYPGSGGCGSDASIRIQFEFDILSGSIGALKIGPYNTQDATDALTTVESINAGELIIRDLAYMHPKAIRKIIERLAYFIARLHPQYTVYENKNGKLVEVDFKELYNHMKQCGISLLEKDIILDKDDPLSLRLIVSLLPEAEVAKRIARVREQQKRKKRNEPTEKYLTRCHFNLFLTNAPRAQIPTDIVWELYKFRWIIELIFKTWKSTWKIHVVKKVSVSRLQCYVYAKLLCIMTNWDIVWKMQKNAQVIGKVILSFDKCSKLISTMVREIRHLFTGEVSVVNQCVKLICTGINQLRIEKRLKKKTLYETIINWNGTLPGLA